MPIVGGKGVRSHGAVPELGLSPPHKDTSFGSVFRLVFSGPSKDAMGFI